MNTTLERPPAGEAKTVPAETVIAAGPKPLYTQEQLNALGFEDIGNGFYVDPDTGEICENRETPFVVRDMESAEWVMKRLQERDAEIVKQWALYQAQCEPIIAALRAALRERNDFEARFKPELEIFAAPQIELQNAKLPASKQVSNLKTRYGKLQFGTSQASIEIPEETKAQAIEWAEKWIPQAVRKEIVKTPLKGHEEQLPVAFFNLLPSRPWFSAQTGIKVPDGVEKLVK